MNRIKVLSEEVSNKIAAGEIIDRPVSIVKELVENALDAEATKITVIIENGGRKKIQVIDNGLGMSEEDALLAFERHATSKIRNVEDIIKISSLGFRGEAIPSIASVSRLEMITKDEESETATKIEAEFGKIRNVSKVPANRGTEVTVQRLFDNLPARKSFLKSEQVELKHITDYMHYQALTFPDIQIRLISNGQEKLNYPAVKDQTQRLSAVLGSGFYKQDFVKISAKSDQVEINGYIAGLEESKGTYDDYRYIFINGRFIRDRIVIHSIRAAYEPFIKKYRIYQQGKTPPYILFLNIDPELIDFNVHPAKLEVRFRDPHLVHSYLKSTIIQALLGYQESKFKIAKEKFDLTYQGGSPSILEKQMLAKKANKKELRQMNVILNELYQPDIFKSDASEGGTTVNIAPLEQRAIPADLYLPPEEEVVNPWQLHNSYILVQSEDGLIMIDQHAAHERIIYEKVFHRMCGVPAESQKMLFPIVVDIPPILRPTVSIMLEENPELFNMVGFSLKTFSGDSVVIDEIPVELGNWDGGEVFIEILSQLQDEYKETEDFRDSIAKAVACKAAIKAGDKISRKEMLQLINDLFACQVPYFCPHGRPVLIKFTLTDLERKFKRI
ncbi:MAG: DNA mismatch repair endonuclease MutL [Candidatus Cloacimonetes bacterium]|nr:DNA mismatch repair endonuclease MutL [Candidatus Cloacimonadota bacterium]